MKLLFLIFLTTAPFTLFASEITLQDIAESNMGEMTGVYQKTGENCSLTIEHNQYYRAGRPYSTIQYYFTFRRPENVTTIGMRGLPFDQFNDKWKLESISSNLSYSYENIVVNFVFDSTSLEIEKIEFPTQGATCILDSIQL